MLGFTPAEQTGAHFAASYDAGGAELRHREGILRPRGRAGRENDRTHQARHRHGPPGLPCDEAHFDESLRRDPAACSQLPGPGRRRACSRTSACRTRTRSDSVPAFTKLQHERFARMIDKGGNAERIPLPSSTTAATPAALRSYPEWAWDMVRRGIILYGSGRLGRGDGPCSPS